ncbi:MAG: DNA-protecting protein DprA [Planctomycetes bacterium]|nr:DNA-protecting protein DprA [Planctomycetota bacterium]
MARQPQHISDATLKLILAPGLGPVTFRKLEKTFSTHDRIVGTTARELTQIEGIGETSAQSLRRAIDQAQPTAQREAMEEHDVRLIVIGDEDYPALLGAIPNAPKALWMRGELTQEDRLAIAMVGSRKCTAYGRDQAGRLSAMLGDCGLTIVSGGAFGIDAESHRGALRVNARTIAVMGCGLARTYPSQHKELFERIIDQGGALLSEFPMNTEPKPEHFPQRNRVISGLSLGVLVVEAAKRSGALITARLAADEHGREAMAIPGRVDSPASAGCLLAIREGWAALVTNHAEVLQQLDASNQLVRGALESAGHPEASSSASLFDNQLTDSQRKIVEVFTIDAVGESLVVEQIAARTQIPLSQLQADLTLLQIRGRISKDYNGIRLRK